MLSTIHVPLARAPFARLLFAVSLAGLSLYAQDAPIMQSLLPRMQAARLNLVETAEFMPADQYGYRLTPPQRTFGAWMEHNIQMNYGSCSSIAAQRKTAPKLEDATKETLIAALKDSFDFCEAAFKAQTDASAVTPFTAGGRTNTPVNVMIGLVVSWNEHYGNLVGYLRSKGITPPTTARAQKGKK
ncbi:MAG: DinB family protein [Bryobacterales bacterium]|nr:DinB family protein [Bryobacterales bacterium]